MFYIFEGLALVIFGIRFLRKGLDRLFGSKLSTWLATMTKSPWQAFGAGIAAGTVAPSSTALSVLSLHMLQTGKVDPEKMVALLLGSGVGMTITAQLLATGGGADDGGYPGYLLIIGVFGFQILQRELYRGIGQCLFSLGLLFLGLHEISKGAGILLADSTAQSLLVMIFNNPFITLLVATIIAVILQSSTATVGLAIGLSAGNAFPSHALVPWIVGTNLGVSVTSLLVGVGSLEGRRLGAASLLARVTVAIPIFVLSNYIIEGLSHLPFSPFRQIAMLQTGFNLVVGLFTVPLLGPLVRLVRFLVAPQPGTEVNKERDFLDDKALESPSLALAMATRQTQFMADKIKVMLDQYWAAETTRNTDLAKKAQTEDQAIDSLNVDINDYLSRIGDGMGQRDTEWQFTLLAFANELESVGDIVETQLCGSLIKRAAELIVFSPVEQDILCQVRSKVVQRLQIAVSFLSWRDSNFAQEFLKGKDQFNDWCRVLEKEHFQRIKSRDPATLRSSPYFLDVLNSFRNINNHISTIGYDFCEDNSL